MTIYVYGLVCMVLGFIGGFVAALWDSKRDRMALEMWAKVVKHA